MNKAKALNTIKVTYKFIDGAHFFVSDDKQAQGLCVAHTDMETAYNEVGYQLSALAKFYEGVSADYHPAVPFHRFKRLLEACQDKVRR